MYCLIQLADILLRIFASIFISDSSPLRKDVKDLHSENYKMQIKKKKIEMTQTKRYTAFVNWNNIANMTTMPKAIYRFNAILVKIPMAIDFFTELE